MSATFRTGFAAVYDIESTPVIICATGPSLTEEQTEIARHLREADNVRVIVVNDAYQRIPNADAIVAADHPWWRLHTERIKKECPTIARWCIDKRAIVDFGCNQYRCEAGTGIAKQGELPKRGSGSGFQAVSLAIQWGARHICLIGFDAKRGADGKTHYFGDHPQRLSVPQPFDLWAREYDSLAEPAEKAGIRIAQCSVDTATTKLIRSTLAKELL